jgi:hypothetical protein
MYCAVSSPTIRLHTDRIKLVDESERLLAAGEAGRYAASFSGVGGSCQIIGWCLTSSQNEQAEAY